MSGFAAINFIFFSFLQPALIFAVAQPAGEKKRIALDHLAFLKIPEQYNDAAECPDRPIYLLSLSRDHTIHLASGLF